MGVSKAQLAGVIQVCQCGCGQTYKAFPVYGPKGTGLRVSPYKVGHHPNTRKTRFGQVPVWNKGLTKDVRPSVGRQGGRGKTHWNYDPDQNPDWFSPDFDFRDFAERFGQRPRSKGGNKAYAKFRTAVMRRDEFTCRDCGMVADESEEMDLLNVHHIVYVKHDKTRIFDPANVVTLCYSCHRKRHRSK